MTSFTDTWNAAFNTTPADTEARALGAQRIRETRLGVKERLEVDHSWAGDADDGAHKKITFVEQASDPTSAANRGFLYTKDVSAVTELFYEDSAGTVQQLTSAGILAYGTPVGTVLDYAGATEPAGWLFCYGQAISRTTYAALFTVLSTTYGVGDGSTTFNLPDCRGRVVAGQDDMGGTSANRLTGLTGGVNGDTLGGTGGEEAHTQTIAEMALHGHPWRQADAVGSSGLVGGLAANDVSPQNVGPFTGTPTSTSGQQIGGQGGSDAFNVVQPTIILNKIIKT